MIDPRVQEAIVAATADMDQPAAVGSRLIAWLEALSAGNTDFTQREETARSCKEIYDHIQIGDAELEDEDEG